MGVLHIKCAAKWSQERPSQALPGRSSGYGRLHPDPLADYNPPTSLELTPKPPNSPQRVVVRVSPPLPQDRAQSVAGVQQNKHHVESDDPKSALQDIIANAMKGVELNRWVSSDKAQPNTVDLWVCIFKVHMCHNVATAD